MEQTRQQLQEQYTQLKQDLYAALIEKIKKVNKESRFSNRLCLHLNYLNENYTELVYTGRQGSEAFIVIDKEGFEHDLNYVTIQELIYLL